MFCISTGEERARERQKRKRKRLTFELRSGFWRVLDSEALSEEGCGLCQRSDC